MKVSYNWLQSYFSKKLPKPEKVVDLLTMHAFEIEGIEKVKKDVIFDIDVLPNRAHDCLSHIGVAKEILALINIKTDGNLSSSITGITGNDSRRRNSRPKLNSLKIEVKDSKLCRRYVGIKIDGIKVGSSPKWLKERLEVVGQKSINNIVDVTNYVMLEFGQPLHAFDADKVDGNIVVRKAKSGEEIITLDEQKVGLDKDILVIADIKKPLAIAGIKGGKKAEVDNKTKNIILESANFEPVNIRKTSRKIGIRTDSSLRFENEISQELAERAINRVVDLILEMSGGQVVSKLDYYPKKVKPVKVEVSASDVSKLLGIEIKEKEIVDILKRLGFGVTHSNKSGQEKFKNTLIADVPVERLDINIKEDLIEEVARIYGYNKIPSILPAGILVPAVRNDNFFYADIVRNILVGAGFSEVYNYTFANKGNIELVNPSAKDKGFLRINLLDGLKKTVEENLRYFKTVRIFEIGKVFLNKNGEIISLSGIISNGDFAEIKGVVEMLLDKLGITDAWFNDHPHKTAGVMIGNTEIGIIDHNAFDISFEMLVRMVVEEMEYQPISKYPAVKRDIALFVPLKTKVVEVLDVIENIAGKLLADTDLFDIYEAEDRKSFAFHLVFQSQEKTLSEKDINTLMDKIFKALEFNPSWEVRK